MTGAELITEFLADHRFGGSWTRSRVLGILNFRYGELLALEDWSFLTTSETITLNAAVVALPANAGLVTDVLMNDYGTPLEAFTLPVFQSMFLALQTTGRPAVYTVLGSSLLIGPTPDGSYPATLIHRADAAALADDSTSPVTPSWSHLGLVAGAQSYALQVENDATYPPLEQTFQGMVDALRRRYLRMLRGTHDQMGSWAPG